MLGGMGLVYICLDLEEDRPVALKTFRPNTCPTGRPATDSCAKAPTGWS